jgi:hypothetical protein
MGGVVAGERVREHCVACGGSGGWRRGRARRPRARAPLLHPPPPPAATPWPSPPPCASQRRPSPWRRPPRPARHGGGPSRKSLWATSPPATPPCWPAATIAATQTMGRCVCQEEKGREWRARSGDRRARARRPALTPSPQAAAWRATGARAWPPPFGAPPSCGRGARATGRCRRRRRRRPPRPHPRLWPPRQLQHSHQRLHPPNRPRPPPRRAWPPLLPPAARAARPSPPPLARLRG